MKTTIGASLNRSMATRSIVATVGALIVAADLWMSAVQWPLGMRALLPIAFIVLTLGLTGGDLDSLGLRVTPVQSIQYWIRTIAYIGTCMLIILCALFLFVMWHNPGMELPRRAMVDVPSVLLLMCVWAPIVEEATYRLVLCLSVAVVMGPIAAVFLSGAVFAGLHFLYGNPGPDNLIAGYFLGWAYLKSGSITVPIGLHSAGNGFALAAQVWAAYQV